MIKLGIGNYAHLLFFVFLYVVTVSLCISPNSITRISKPVVPIIPFYAIFHHAVITHQCYNICMQLMFLQSLKILHRFVCKKRERERADNGMTHRFDPCKEEVKIKIGILESRQIQSHPYIKLPLLTHAINPIKKCCQLQLATCQDELEGK